MNLNGLYVKSRFIYDIEYRIKNTILLHMVTPNETGDDKRLNSGFHLVKKNK